MVPYFTGLAIIISAVFATAGWFITNRLQQILSRRQHTFVVINAYRNDKEFNEVRIQVRQIFAANNVPSPNDTNRSSDIENLDWLLNHYEFITGAIITGDIDERLMKGFEYSRMQKLFKNAEDYIEANREIYNQSTMFGNLQNVCERWNKKNRTIGERIYEFYMLRPCLDLPRWLIPIESVIEKLRIDRVLIWCGFIPPW